MAIRFKFSYHDYKGAQGATILSYFVNMIFALLSPFLGLSILSFPFFIYCAVAEKSLELLCQGSLIFLAGIGTILLHFKVVMPLTNRFGRWLQTENEISEIRKYMTENGYSIKPIDAKNHQEYKQELLRQLNEQKVKKSWQ